MCDADCDASTAPMNGLAGLCGKARIHPSDVITPPFPSADLCAHNECMVAGAAAAHGAHARARRYARATEPSAVLRVEPLHVWKLQECQRLRNERLLRGAVDPRPHGHTHTSACMPARACTLALTQRRTRRTAKRACTHAHATTIATATTSARLCANASSRVAAIQRVLLAHC